MKKKESFKTFKHNFLVWIRNRFISAVLQPVLSHTEKSCKASYYRQFSINIKIKIIKLIPVLLAQAFGLSWLAKLVFILLFSWKYPRKSVYKTMFYPSYCNLLNNLNKADAMEREKYRMYLIGSSYVTANYELRIKHDK